MKINVATKALGLLCMIMHLSCRTTSTDFSASTSQGVAPAVLDYDLLLTVGGETARAMFIGMTTPARETKAAGEAASLKEISTEVSISCVVENKVETSSLQTTCKVTSGFKGDRANIKTKALFTLSGAAATDFYEEFNVPEIQSAHKVWSGKANIYCINYLDDESYYCDIKDMTTAARTDSLDELPEQPMELPPLYDD
jgi:hypothetical protein